MLPPEPRRATAHDLPALATLIDASVRVLSAGYYDDEQIERALTTIFGPDTQLVADGTYYVIDDPHGGGLAAGGGWSRHRALYGGDQHRSAGDDALLDPATEPARIRAFFVHPAWARRGLARRLFAACQGAAAAAGFRDFTLTATLPGVPLYTALGFRPVEHFAVPLSDGYALPVVQMTRPVAVAH